MRSPLKAPPNPAFSARKPQQQRAKARVEAVLTAAEQLLLSAGHTGFSIPSLADQLDFPRATIYKFFPTPHALLNELAERHVTALEAHLVAYSERLVAAKDWQQMIGRMVEAAVDYYRAHPAAQIVLLAGPISDSSFRALEGSITRLGSLTRNLLGSRGIAVPEGSPDLAALAVEFGTASFRMSYFLHGEITPPYAQAAADVMIAFLGHRLSLT